MMIGYARLRQLLAESYLAALSTTDRWAIRGRSGPRVFGRVAVVAAMQKRNGITNGARLQVEALRRAGVAADLLDATPALRNPLFRIAHDPATAYVFHSGGPQLASMLASVLPHAARAWRVAYWAWELPTPPRRWPDPTGLVSEIWTPSAFARRSLAMGFNLPIHVVPHAVLSSGSRRRRSPHAPFTVLTMADSRSSFARKNPAGAIAAFVRAFGDSDQARLIVKLSEESPTPVEFPTGRNIQLIKRFLDAPALLALVRSADVLLSLHRAEGFGLPMIEAMAEGVPVVATGWSGNLDFMSDANASLVPARIVPVQDSAVYHRYGDVMWAEPDEAAAANALRRLCDDQRYYEDQAKAGFEAAAAFSRTWHVPEKEAVLF